MITFLKRLCQLKYTVVLKPEIWDHMEDYIDLNRAQTSQMSQGMKYEEWQSLPD